MILDLLIDFVYPKKCVGCGRIGEFLCDDCLRELEYTEQICPECGEESVMGWTHEKCKKKLGLDGLISVFTYQDEKVRNVIDGIKFDFNRELVEIVVNSCDFDLGVRFDYIVPIPLYFYRENWRGFNQAEELGKRISEQTGVEMVGALKRVVNTKQQSLLKDRDDRKKNLQGAYIVGSGVDLKEKTVLLVDDVFTTGSSLKEACKVLKKAGVKAVWGFCLAH